MVEFAGTIGAKQSTVSRYESGKLVPGRPVLLLLLQLAEANEKRPILEALGVDERFAEGWNELRLIEALRTFERYLEASRSQKGLREASSSPRPALEAFAETAKKIILECQDVHPSVLGILNQWLKYGKDPETLEFFRHAAAYLEVELTALSSPKTVRRRQSTNLLSSSHDKSKPISPRAGSGERPGSR
jgi:transcriptional regulator with XRE-family HTH domain